MPKQNNTSVVNQPNPAMQKKTILIVDDEFDLTSTFSMLFQLNGFETITANNGQHALEQMKQHMPDIILSDCMMPVMDGIQLARHVRSRSETAHIPIMLMSAVPQQQLLDEALCNAFIKKPFRFKDLLDITHSLLSSGEKHQGRSE